MNKLFTADKFIARLLMISYFLPVKVPVFLVVSSLYFLVRSIVSKEYAPKKNLIWAVILGGGYFLYIGSIFLTPPKNQDVLIFLTEYRVSQLLAPLIFAFIAPTIIERIKSELIFFSYACFISCIYGNFGYLYHIHQLGSNFHLTPLSHVDYRICIEQFTGIHPTYLAMYQCFAISIILCTNDIKKKWAQIMNWIVLYGLIIATIAIFAKSPFIALIIILMHYGYLNRKYFYQYKWMISGVIALFLTSYFIIPFFSQRINEIFRLFGNDQTNRFANNSMLERQLIWNIDLELLKDYWLTGVGPGRLQIMLNAKYFFYSISSNTLPGYYDPHNEYLWQWLAFGILGFLSTFFILVIHFVKAIRFKNNLYFYLLIILAITFSTESVMARQHGVLFYGIFTSMFFFFNANPSINLSLKCNN